MQTFALIPAAALVAGGLALAPTSVSALPVSPAPLVAPGLLDQVGWAESLERGGKRFLRTTKRNAPKRDVSSTGNVERPDRPANQAGWGQMPGGPRRYGR